MEIQFMIAISFIFFLLIWKVFHDSSRHKNLMDEKDNQIVTLNAQLNKLNSEILSLKNELSAKDKHIITQNSQINKLTTKITFVKNTLSKKNKYIETQNLQINKLNSEIFSLKNICSGMNNQIVSQASENSFQKSKWKEYHKKKDSYNNSKSSYDVYEQEVMSQLFLDSNNFCFKKDSCMTPNESPMFSYINRALDDFFPDEALRNCYYLFPQVSLHSIISLKSLSKQKKDIVSKYLLSKNVDFVICHCSYKPVHKSKEDDTTEENSFYAYEPILMIEIDGSSHFSSEIYGQKSYERQKLSDAMKDSIGENLHIPLLRYNLTDNQVQEKDCIGIKQKMERFFA